MKLRQESDQNQLIKNINHIISYVAGRAPCFPAAQFNLTLTYLPTPLITSECFLGEVCPTDSVKQADNSITSAIWCRLLSRSL